ncbi:MAG: UMP kinase [Candidatus Melainabacteria bacterium RIFOXYA12_FULL_32_12]|nr:MAG: UMP kinase [Candidatus Melainabacteria bacterium RIFOXYA12_FULL_32_12]
MSQSDKGLKYKRVLLKVSGEALMGEQGFGIDPDVVNKVAQEIKEVHDSGAEVAIVVGGGNIFRGVQNSTKLGMDQASADYVGMLATVMNALILQGVLRKAGVSTRVLTALTMNAIAEPYIRFRAMRHLEKGRVVIFAAGTGNPFFTTDTAAALRASEIDAELMLMAKNKVDGVYNKDPRKFPDAKKYDYISYDDMIVQDLKVIDTAAVALCKNNNIPIVVFDFEARGSIEKILKGEKVGTLVGGNPDASK